MINRRSFLLTAGAALAVPAFGASAAPAMRKLAAGPGRAQLTGGMRGATDVWCFDGAVPGPELRLPQGVPARIAVENRLSQSTTVHWHGVRVPNAMDGVPDLTQKPIAPGETFIYEFTPPDAGTFWYHPHQRSFEQIVRGLAGALIVEEPAPPLVDRDVTWVLQDWRLLNDGTISGDFGNRMDMAMSGRIGNTVTINGAIPDAFPVRAGERIRLRLINAASARIFALEFSGHTPTIIALDGQPVAPHAPEDGRVVLGPAMRADLVLDLIGQPGQRYPIIDTFYRRLEYRLTDLVYAAEPLREHPLDAPIRLEPNPLREPDIGAAIRHEIAFEGGMMGMMGDGNMMRGMMGMMGGGNMMRGMMGDSHHVWSINGVSAQGHMMTPLLTLDRGKSYILALSNDTAWHHPMHLHGHSFRVMSRNGNPTRHREWRDTVLLAPRERAEIAFVADNPGDWMLHCHILDHQEGGMMGVIRVA